MSSAGSLKITFMTTIGVNVGDDFIREGIRAVLDRAGISYRPFYVNKHDRASISVPYDEETGVLPDKYRDSDIFIQSGAPVYWRLDEGRATSITSEWHDWLWQERILAEGKSRPVFLNLGAGSCMPWGDPGDDFVANAACAEFAREAGRRAALTTVRDPLASDILRRIGVAHHEIPCPAFLAGARHAPVRPHDGFIGVNLMPRGAHFKVRDDFSVESWHKNCRELLVRLREKAPVVFIAHDAEEAAFMAGLAAPGERVTGAKDWRGYLDLYSACKIVVANRVHGSVCAAGFGVPSLIMGTDSRAMIGDYIGIPKFESVPGNHGAVGDAAIGMLDEREERSRELIQTREKTLERYAMLVRDAIGHPGADHRRS